MPVDLPRMARRWTPVLLHLLASVLVLLAISALLLGLWFPAPFFSASGGWQGLKLVAIVLLPGPLLTLVVSNSRKDRRVLARDLGLIVTLQCLALTGCVYTLYGQRPVAVVFWESEFYTVTADELAEHGYPASKLARFGKDRPAWVYRPKPVSAEGLRQILRQTTANGVPPHHQIDAFLPYRAHFSELAWHGLDIGEITQSNPTMKAELDALLHMRGGKTADYRYLALKAKYRNVVLVFTQSGERVGHLYAPYLDNP